MSVGLFITEKMPRTIQPYFLISKKNSKDKFTAKPFVSALLKHFQHIKTSLQLLLLLQKVLHEAMKAKCHEFPKFYGFKASSKSREYIFSVHPRSYK